MNDDRTKKSLLRKVPAWAWIVGIPLVILIGITACVAAVILVWPYMFTDAN